MLVNNPPVELRDSRPWPQYPLRYKRSAEERRRLATIKAELSESNPGLRGTELHQAALGVLSGEAATAARSEENRTLAADAVSARAH